MAQRPRPRGCLPGTLPLVLFPLLSEVRLGLPSEVPSRLWSPFHSIIHSTPDWCPDGSEPGAPAMRHGAPVSSSGANRAWSMGLAVSSGKAPVPLEAPWDVVLPGVRSCVLECRAGPQPAIIPPGLLFQPAEACCWCFRLGGGMGPLWFAWPGIRTAHRKWRSSLGYHLPGHRVPVGLASSMSKDRGRAM